ncbi:DUF6093 family protein [Brachybacterium hainanense]|uniref:DUF6093 family protein n=1 Tax=Brachybacterium hainanense TaxID=1541174 RepID=A0ABV6R9A0_9MICO
MDDLTAMLAEARDIQGLAMIDTVRIDRSTGRHQDRETGKETEGWERVWEGEARLPRADAVGRVVVTGETITPAQPVVLIPWHVAGVRPDDRVTCVESVSPAMVGRILWVTDASPRTFQSAVHLTCREVR